MTIEVGKIRNVGVVGHGGVGKTSLVEALLFSAGALTRLGKVDDGSTTTDFDPDEIKRKISINTSIAYCDWKGHRVNVVDTPGYGDFIADARAGLRVVEAAVVVVKMKAVTYAGGKPAEGEIPGDLSDRAKEYREKLVEAAAETDDELLSKYLEEGSLGEPEMLKALRAGIAQGKLVPVVCASAAKNMGSASLLDLIVEALPMFFAADAQTTGTRSEEHTSELQSLAYLVC